MITKNILRLTVELTVEVLDVDAPAGRGAGRNPAPRRRAHDDERVEQAELVKSDDTGASALQWLIEPDHVLQLVDHIDEIEPREAVLGVEPSDGPTRKRKRTTRARLSPVRAAALFPSTVARAVISVSSGVLERTLDLIVAFSITPLGVGEGVAEPVARAVKVVRESGLPNRTDSMFTTIEGEWDEVMSVVKQAVDAVAEVAPRVSLVLKADLRAGVTDGMTSKIESLERHLP